ARRETQGLAHGDVLSLLPLSTGPPRAAPLWSPHRAVQADLLQQDRPMGIVRFAKGPTRTEQRLCQPRLRRDAQAFEGGALSAQKRTQGRGSVCQWRASGCSVIARSNSVRAINRIAENRNSHNHLGKPPAPLVVSSSSTFPGLVRYTG